MAAVTHSGKATVTLPTDTQILITREFDAPRHLVYRATTDPELVKRWWSGHRGEVTSAEIDLRVGGRWRYVMVANAGFEVAFHGTYREIVPDERIVSTELFEGAPGATEDDATVNTVTFDERRRADPPHDRGRVPDEGDPRHDHRVGHGGRHAGGLRQARGARALAGLSDDELAMADHRVKRPRWSAGGRQPVRPAGSPGPPGAGPSGRPEPSRASLASKVMGASGRRAR